MIKELEEELEEELLEDDNISSQTILLKRVKQLLNDKKYLDYNFCELCCIAICEKYDLTCDLFEIRTREYRYPQNKELLRRYLPTCTYDNISKLTYEKCLYFNYDAIPSRFQKRKDIKYNTERKIHVIDVIIRELGNDPYHVKLLRKVRKKIPYFSVIEKKFGFK